MAVNGDVINNKNNNLKNSNKKKKKKHAVRNKIIILFSILILTLASLGFFIFNYLFGGLTQTKIAKDFSTLGIDSSRAEQTKELKVINIALYGVDSRSNTDTGLSDAILVASIDIAKGKIKLTSIARDTYVSFTTPSGVPIKTKITEAYSIGQTKKTKGAELAIKTLNQNFNLDIQDYVTVNFSQLAKVIDSVGGVTVNLSVAEKNMANGIMNELTPKEKKITQTGAVLLNGNQAVAYSRIRKIDSDDVRAQRQRNVLEQLFLKAKNMNMVEIGQLVHTVMPMVETSLDYSQIMDMAAIFKNSNVQLQQMAFPNSQSNAAHGDAAMVDGKWFYIYDLNVAKRQLYDFIYNDIKVD